MCEHGRLKCVGYKGVTRVFCCECGKELDIAFLEGKNSAKNPPADESKGKSTGKKRTAKKAV